MSLISNSDSRSLYYIAKVKQKSFPTRLICESLNIYLLYKLRKQRMPHRLMRNITSRAYCLARHFQQGSY